MSLVVVVPELLLEFVDNGLVHLESPGEDVCVDRRVGPEHGVGDGDDSRVLAAKSGESHRRSVTGVELKVDETDREHEHVTFLELLREELVLGALDVRGHETHQELSLHHHQDFRGAWVSVWRVLSVRRVVDTRELYPESVEPRESVDGHGGYNRADRVVGVSGHVEARSEEIVGLGEHWILAESPVHKH